MRYKDRNNYCDYFSPVTVVGGATRAKSAPADSARKKFDDLFKNL